MKISVEPEYVSIACNRVPEIVDWNSNGLICYGGSNAVIIYDTNQVGGNPLTVLCHHKSKVNSVKWLRKPDGTSTELISCSADKTAAIWTLCNNIYKVTSTLIGHSDGVTCIGGVYLNDDDVQIYTSSIDSTVKIWERRNGTTTFKQTISLNSGLCLTLAGHILPSIGQPILFLALDDHKVHVYAATTVPDGSGDKDEYRRLHVLTGHEDWVRGLDVMNVDAETILLASCSQDTYIRIWRLQLHHKVDHEPSSEIKVEERLFTAYSKEWSAKLESVLAGHEGWVYGVQWAPSEIDQGTNTRKPVYRLLSSSLDKTLILWEPVNDNSHSDGVWLDKVRVGEVGGNGLGFYGSRFGPGARAILGHGYNGSFHIWKIDEATNQWESSVVVGGHFGPVTAVRWDPLGGFVCSGSHDQTTRVHAPWDRRDGTKREWHEIARPQVHGYDISSLALVSSTTFISTAEEKVVRVFSAPHSFVENFKSITGLALDVENGVGPEGASVPSLGLSNKAVFAGEEDEGVGDDDFAPLHLTAPPTEESLMSRTLWPEVHKLYGHGYEVLAAAAAASGRLVATACKATTAEHAAVIVWETKNWQQTQKLVSHQLTVTQLAFSPDSKMLLSVSRDRKWTLWQRKEGDISFDMAATTDKTNGVHSRIIWCCAWATDSLVFGTGSRDGKICLWTKTDKKSESTLKEYGLYGPALELQNMSVTALAFAPVSGQARVIAAGLDCGLIQFYKATGNGWSLLLELDNSAAHHLTVKMLSFDPSDKGTREMALASCGSDNLVRIYKVYISC